MTTNKNLDSLAVLGVFGVVGLGLTAMVGFEEPNDMLLLFSSVLILAVPVVMLVHLGMTTELTAEEKRLWVRELTGLHAISAFSDYLASRDRRATIKQRTDEALARREGQQRAARRR